MNKIEKFRTIMKENNIDYYIITSSDPHQSEYVADYYKGRAYLSGFTGSAGTLLISSNEAKLWTDGRYFIQAEKELKDSGIELMKIATPGYPTIEEFIESSIEKGQSLGFCGKCYSVNAYKKLKEKAANIGFDIIMDKDLLNNLWNDRPELPQDKINLHSIDFAGEASSQKISRVKDEMNRKQVDNYIISSLDDIAWLFNIRGNDIKFSPVAIAYALISKDKVNLYMHKSKVDKIVVEELMIQGIDVKEYTEIINDIRKITNSVLIDPNRINSYIYSNISSSVRVVEDIDITTKLKAIKNHIELDNIENCQVRDGVAMVKFMKWLKSNIDTEEINELSATDKLSKFREEQEFYQGDSFGTIAAYKEHAAMMHYSANSETNYTINKEGFFLLDSGGQYFDGTTDITRTFVMGHISDEQRRDYTLVLKGHINLSMARFLKGTNGMQLDILARGPLWKYGIDYKCGTGHGVGFFLNVHEGPQGIRPSGNTIPLETGMILTNEPGVYKEGKYGIRIENMLVVKEDFKNEFGVFYKFDTISYCPIDTDGIDKSLLTDDEIKWLNDYHQLVYKKLETSLDKDEKEYLLKVTQAI